MTEPLLTVSAAHKRFGSTAALQGASLVLHPGEILGLLGPNGAGKSTLIRAIAGRVVLDRGAIERQTTARLGVVPQEIAVYEALTARENLSAFAAFHGIAPPEQAATVAWALDWTGLTDRADEPVTNFSGGMRRRLNLACGVLHRPQIVLLDEPTVGVDPQSRARINDMLLTLRAQGTALLLTTHQLDEAEQLCDRLTLIDGGQTIADGTLAGLLRTHLGATRLVVTVPTATTMPTDWRPCCTATHSTAATDTACDWECALDDGAVAMTLSQRLTALLAQLQPQNVAVADVRLWRPTLQDLFLHLTGRALRDE